MSLNNKVRPLKETYLYNMLQDNRHLLIFDLRSSDDFQEFYIRDSFNVNKSTAESDIVQVIQLADKKATDNETKYKQLKPVRRYFFIKPTAETQGAETASRIAEISKSIETFKHSAPDVKLYSLECDFSKWAQKYHFMCLSNEKLAQVSKAEKQQEADKILLYPYAKFPSEIVPDRLFLSGVYCSNSQKQLKDLKIGTLIDFIDYQQNEVLPSFKKQAEESQNSQVADQKSVTKEGSFSYLHMPFNEKVPGAIDFDLINQEIDQYVSAGEQRGEKVLLYCRDGEVISPAFAVSYLMWKSGLDINMATLKVCQAISRVEICKWIYTQLLTYKPKK